MGQRKSDKVSPRDEAGCTANSLIEVSWSLFQYVIKMSSIRSAISRKINTFLSYFHIKNRSYLTSMEENEIHSMTCIVGPLY